MKKKMAQPIPCPHRCGKSFKTNRWLQKHLESCLPPKIPPKKANGEAKRAVKPKRKSLCSKLRIQVWETYIGQKTKGVCFCCHDKINPIRPFSYSNTFQAGHIISHANGGKDSIENLIPICRDCNMNMGAENWDDYVARQPHLRLRVYGDNPPKEVIWATTIIQSLVRMYLERKKPNSPWRVEWHRRLVIN